MSEGGRKFNPNRKIRLPLHDISVGTLLTEMSRAYCHTGTGSAMVTRILTGLSEYTQEMVGDLTADDIVLLNQFRDGLHTLRVELRKSEDNIYGVVEADRRRNPQRE